MTGDSFTATSYLASFQNPGRCLRDPELRGGTVDRPGGGPLRPMDGGGFSSIFRVTSADRRRSWAVKCFLRPTAELSARYEAIGAALEGVTDFWKVGFGYDPEGLFHLPQNRWVPTLKMAWVNGTSLIPWLEARLGDEAALHRLALEFTKVAGALERAGIAHGDLQHGNIIVVAGDRIRLVDYDGMYVPALAGFRMPECGIPHYQPPDRDRRGYFGPAADRFSARVIRLSVRAVAAESGLWGRLHEPGGEYLILRDGDFAAPDASEAFRLLAASRDPWVREETEQLLRDITTSPEEIPPLRPLDGAGPAPKVAGLPAWMRRPDERAAASPPPSTRAEPPWPTPEPDEAERATAEDVVTPPLPFPAWPQLPYAPSSTDDESTAAPAEWRAAAPGEPVEPRAAAPVEPAGSGSGAAVFALAAVVVAVLLAVWFLAF
ncbi:hypothetical protein [Actinomadura bangladeshensis]|uniref:Protein kinase domain-containing protein n=1 Tax=Actinomadura bangladeshensis TaxID=453573 RepID=A0A4R4NM92_9ACTN|nr:hypothetical protein [Actinomadura bangladeshensis]TDC09884.1 hypothetical protein E1284_28860 [Actinomadura bangladeshensis]